MQLRLPSALQWAAPMQGESMFQRSTCSLPDRGDAGSCKGGCAFCHCSKRARLEDTPSPAATAGPLVPLPSAELTRGELLLKRPNRENLQRPRGVCYTATHRWDSLQYRKNLATSSES